MAENDSNMINLISTHLTHPWGPPWTLGTLGDMPENVWKWSKWPCSGMTCNFLGYFLEKRHIISKIRRGVNPCLKKTQQINPNLWASISTRSLNLFALPMIDISMWFHWVSWSECFSTSITRNGHASDVISFNVFNYSIHTSKWNSGTIFVQSYFLSFEVLNGLLAHLFRLTLLVHISSALHFITLYYIYNTLHNNTLHYISCPSFPVKKLCLCCNRLLYPVISIQIDDHKFY